MPLLEIENLSVSFDTAAGPFLALDKVSYRIDTGEVLAIVGESGSGKSVAMLAMMGLLPPTATVTADKMEFEGRDLLTMPESERRKIIGKDISMIFQEPIASLNPCFAIGFQIEEVLKTHLGLKPSECRKRAVELLASVGIDDGAKRLNSFPHQLSGGQCQRVMIAMATPAVPSSWSPTNRPPRSMSPSRSRSSIF